MQAFLICRPINGKGPKGTWAWGKERAGHEYVPFYGLSAGKPVADLVKNMDYYAVFLTIIQ